MEYLFLTQWAIRQGKLRMHQVAPDWTKSPERWHTVKIQPSIIRTDVYRQYQLHLTNKEDYDMLADIENLEL